MKTETEDEWEETCRIEVEARDKKTEIFGVLSDRNLRGYMTNHSFLRSIDNEDEDWSKILDASMYAAKIREIIGLAEPDYTPEEIPAAIEMEGMHRHQD